MKKLLALLKKQKEASLDTDHLRELAPMFAGLEARISKLDAKLKKAIRDTALDTGSEQTPETIRQAVAQINYERDLDGIIKEFAKRLPAVADSYFKRSVGRVSAAYDESLPGFIRVRSKAKGKAPRVVYDKPLATYFRELRAKTAERIDAIIGKATQPAPEGAKGAFLDTINADIEGMGSGLLTATQRASQAVFATTFQQAEVAFNKDFALGAGVVVEIVPKSRAEILKYLQQVDSRADALPEDSSLDTIAEWNRRVNGKDLESYFTEEVTAEEYEWVSVIDDRTGELDAALDGKRFKYGESVLPPLHPNCRCRVIPVVNDKAYR